MPSPHKRSQAECKVLGGVWRDCAAHVTSCNRDAKKKRRQPGRPRRDPVGPGILTRNELDRLLR
jgi:hypothetical protein